MDQIALEYWYYGFLGRFRIDGRGFFHQKPILKNIRQNRNQDAAHAQKRVTVPFMNETLSGGLRKLKNKVQLGNPQSGRGRWREFFFTKFKSAQFNGITQRWS